MSDYSVEPVIRVDGVGKRFRIGRPPDDGGRHRGFGRLLRVSGNGATEPRPVVWALRDVTFQVAPGRVFGVIGRNGSGKTTLMKIIARITAPTEGTVVTLGRVGALLKVGTGFHPELSGRDNIALSGAILGMTRDEIAAVYDEIVDFAEVGRFLYTPVKHYSSGMHVRLAFAVSSHMPAATLIIDEVLSVGDGPFQRRCYERMRRIVDEGRTILYVSHNMASVRDLCEEAIVLHAGTVRFTGTATAAIDFYETQILGERRSGNGGPRGPKTHDMAAHEAG